ncbi:MAG TPA: hypothetical protein VJ183_08980 [Chloroflexia bacterium]|nr:hypothetical protein [Chloroflexia bacterium]
MSMFDQKIRVLSEGLARRLDRREFLKQTGTTMFAGIAALAAGHSLTGNAAASSGTNSRAPLIPNCNPPGPYCNLNGNIQDPNGCHGGSCFQHRTGGQIYQCYVYYTYYSAGCWTTPTGGGYWTCCDCDCRNSAGQRVATCGCAQYSTGPVPRPDGPGARG